MKMRYSVIKVFGILMMLCLAGCDSKQYDTNQIASRAELLFRSVYEGKTENIDSLVSDDIVASYPIFEEIFNKKALRGKAAYTEFAEGFNKKWKDAKVIIHETICEGDKVVLVWSFSATKVGDMNQDANLDTKFSWGGISLFRFDTAGKIKEEIGEESSPGPFYRLN